MQKDIRPTILVIVGITGDLARRKLLPALSEIAAAKLLPKDFKIAGISRRDVKIEDILTKKDRYLQSHLDVFKMDLDNPNDYKKLGRQLAKIEKTFKVDAQRLFYLSVPPDHSQPIITHLGQAQLNTEDSYLMLEKPFGKDLKSARQMVRCIHKYFKESQVYRIDHYLAKEMAQNILIFRSANSLFKHSWNKQFIESIEILAIETIGIEGRSTFYEQTGALRDILQSHLMQLAAITLLDLPDQPIWEDLPKRRENALKQLHIAKTHKPVVKGQYESYREEVKNPASNVETYLSIEMRSRNTAWKNVPIRLTTGKSLDRKTTEIRLKYHSEHDKEANELVFRIQPNEGLEICLWMKKPGLDSEIEQKKLILSYQHLKNELHDAYERVFVDAMRGDRTLFASSDEIITAWKVLASIQKQWANSGDDLISYKKGSSSEELALQALLTNKL